MEERIKNFIKEQKVLSLSTSKDNVSYSASCFYAFDEANKLLIFSSENSTNHIKQAIENTNVSGTINKEVTTVAKIQGLQFLGEFINPTEELQKAFYQVYYKRFSFAKAKPAPIWAIQLTWVKMTDNTLGFGKKLEWKK